MTQGPERTNNPQPGWYPNPEAAEQIRWWDGEEWTSHVAPNPAVAPPVGPPPPAPSQLVPDQNLVWDAEATETQRSESEPQGPSEWLTEVLGSITARFGHLFTLTLVFGLVPSCIQFAVLYFGMKNLVVTTDTHADSWGVSGVATGVWVGFGASILFTIVCGLILWLAMSRQIQLHRVANPEPWSASIKPALRRLLPIVGLHLLLGVVSFIGFIGVAIFVGVFAALFPLTLLVTVPLFLALTVYVGVRISLTLTAASIGPRDTFSITNSVRLTKGKFGLVIVRLMIMTLVAFAAFLFSTMLTGLVGSSEPLMEGTSWLPELTAEMIFGSNPAGFALTTILGGFANAFLGLVVLASLVVLYGDLGGEMAHDLKADHGQEVSSDSLPG